MGSSPKPKSSSQPRRVLRDGELGGIEVGGGGGFVATDAEMKEPEFDSIELVKLNFGLLPSIKVGQEVQLHLDEQPIRVVISGNLEIGQVPSEYGVRLRKLPVADWQIHLVQLVTPRIRIRARSRVEMA